MDGTSEWLAVLFKWPKQSSLLSEKNNTHSSQKLQGFKKRMEGGCRVNFASHLTKKKKKKELEVSISETKARCLTFRVSMQYFLYCISSKHQNHSSLANNIIYIIFRIHRRDKYP